MKAAGAKDMQTEMSINALSVVTDSVPFLGLHGILYGFGSGGSPRLWHTDVGHVSLRVSPAHSTCSLGSGFQWVLQVTCFNNPLAGVTNYTMFADIKT